MTRLGVFGGTFDPIHNGHLRMAEEARERFALDKVLLVPNAVSPFKTDRNVTPGQLRAEMIRRAIADNSFFALDTREIERPAPSYTVETLRALKAEHPHADLFFLTGTDAVRGLPGWHAPQELLALAQFIAAARPGVQERDVLAALPSTWEARVLFLPMPELDISSTDLRARARDGRSLRYLTPHVVEGFVREQGLYLPIRDPEANSFAGEIS
ncbi:MAG: nicotinate-nucleotide adenylyltransferase [Cytophagales bacterium]|nr:nicotinate-nucleotide adenylyltransferase [Armatimonadota bacterium]